MCSSPSSHTAVCLYSFIKRNFSSALLELHVNLSRQFISTILSMCLHDQQNGITTNVTNPFQMKPKKCVTFCPDAIEVHLKKKLGSSISLPTGSPRVLNDEDRYLLYSQRPDLDYFSRFPELQKRFEGGKCLVRVFIDTEKIGKTRTSKCNLHTAKVLQAWHIRLQNDFSRSMTYAHSLIVLQKTYKNGSATMVFLGDGQFICETGPTDVLFSFPRTVWHSFVLRDGEGDAVILTDIKVTQEIYNNNLCLEINGKRFASKSVRDKQSKKIMDDLPSGALSVLKVCCYSSSLHQSQLSKIVG